MFGENISPELNEKGLTEALAMCASYLKKRDLTKKEVSSKLAEKGFEESVVDASISYLVDRGYLSEERVVVKELEGSRGAKARGDALIRARLLDRGIPAEIVQTNLESDAVPTERDRALELLRLKFPRGGPQSRISRFFWSRGFSEETIESILSGLRKDDEWESAA